MESALPARALSGSRLRFAHLLFGRTVAHTQAMRSLGLLLAVSLVAVATGCSHKSASQATSPQLKQGGSTQAAAEEWVTAVKDFAPGFYSVLADHASLTAELIGMWGTARQPDSSRVMLIKNRIHTVLIEAQTLPGGTSEIEDVNGAVVRGLTLMERAYDDYLAGLRTGRLRLLEDGDALVGKAVAEFTKAQPSFRKVVGTPTGGLDAEVQLLAPVVRGANIEANDAVDLYGDMIPALKQGDLTQAKKLAAEAKRHIDHGLSRLQALPKPENPELQTYVQRMVGAFQLLSIGSAAYLKGLSSLDVDQLRLADAKTKRGFTEVYRASEKLLRYAQTLDQP